MKGLVIKLTEDERKHIKKRLRQGARVEWVYRILRIFPINRKKIVFMTFEGNGGYGCNPRYIAEEIRNRKLDLELVWLVNDMSKKFPEEIKKVKNTFWNRAYHLVTAKAWVANARMNFGTLKRRGQIYFQTWHGAIEFKAVGKFRGKLFPKIAEIISKNDSKMIDYVQSNSDWCTRKYPQMLLYKGEIVKIGSPRCDLFTTKRDKVYRMIRKRYQLPSDSKIIIFAPTFRGGSQQGKREIHSELPRLDYDKLIKALSDKFGGEWYIMTRLHPQIAALSKDVTTDTGNENVVDASQADDMNELIAGCDAFITDYSSAAFDAMNLQVPVFLFADDLQEYIEERGQLMWDMFQLPFPFAQSNEELVENIMTFEEKKYNNDTSDFLNEHGVLEDGMAAKRAAGIILENMWRE